MKVLLVNGSPRGESTTHRGLKEVAAALEQNGIETQIFWIGRGPIQGCVGCYSCRGAGSKGCPYDKLEGDKVAEFVALAKEADGFIFGSPVYYASIAGGLVCFMNRLFFANGAVLKGKPAAAVVAARRAGTTAALDTINKYFLLNQMPVASANYWNAIHGHSAADAEKDIEGLQTMRAIGNNMAWLLKGIKAGESFSDKENKIYTNFIS